MSDCRYCWGPVGETRAGPVCTVCGRKQRKPGEVPATPPASVHEAPGAPDDTMTGMALLGRLVAVGAVTTGGGWYHLRRSAVGKDTMTLARGEANTIEALEQGGTHRLAALRVLAVAADPNPAPQPGRD